MSEKIKVFITLEGGVIHNVEKPENVEVVVMDFDIEGVEEARLKKNASGEEYVETVW